jgi:dTMP kinase
LLDFSTGGLKPNLTLLLDVPVISGLERKRDNGVEWNRLDAYEEAFHKRVRSGYQELAQAEPERWVTIDATQDKESVQEEMRKVVMERLQRR